MFKYGLLEREYSSFKFSLRLPSKLNIWSIIVFSGELIKSKFPDKNSINSLFLSGMNLVEIASKYGSLLPD